MIKIKKVIKTRKYRKTAKAKSRIKRQPRCMHGFRLSKSARIHEAVYDGLQKIAIRERRSVSWVLHEIVADWFNLDIMGDKK